MGGAWRWVALTPPVVLLAHALAVLPHEFAHRVMAWALGVPVDPLAIDWGGTSLANLLLLIHVDEGPDCPALPAEGPGWRVAPIAVAGHGIANGGLTIWARRRADEAARWPSAGRVPALLVLRHEPRQSL